MTTVVRIGYAGRRPERFRFDGDQQEFTLQFSAELAEELCRFLDDPATGPLSEALVELRSVLVDMLKDGREGVPA